MNYDIESLEDEKRVLILQKTIYKTRLSNVEKKIVKFMMSTLSFDSNKKECYIINSDEIYIYKCNCCNFITMGSDADKCIESRNEHMMKTGHTTKRIW